MKEILERAFAKVNFGLRVLPKSEIQEFHSIESIFQTVDLYDELRISFDEKSSDYNHCFVSCDSLILPPKNTLTVAFHSFCDIVEFEVPSVKVEIKKGIPVGGGLGGGSADGAALIRGLEKLFNLKLSEQQRFYIADKTGSDVFFFMKCINGVGAAKVSGRGECVHLIKGRKDLILVMVFPKEGSCTKEAYDLVDKLIDMGEAPEAPAFEDYEIIYNLPANNWTFVNTFTPAIQKCIPSVVLAINELNKCNPLYVNMSGSGSTVFAVFDKTAQAENCLKLLRKSFNCRIVHALLEQ